MAGMKSYGRAPTFLARTGYEQVRSIADALAGDHEAAARVELVLNETGVCGGAGLFDSDESIAETEKDFVSNNLPAVICAHIADGNFHCCVPYQPKCGGPPPIQHPGPLLVCAFSIACLCLWNGV